jgi:dUTP pyrophosphatase
MESMNINIKLLNDKAVIPFKANDDDANACYDVVATSINHDADYGFIEYGLGFATEFSSDWECQVRPRSSVSKYDLLMCNTPGTIDSGYRGEWKVRFKVCSDENKFYEVGDRVAQISFHKVTKTLFNKVDELNTSLRGDGGFGSTNANA